MRSGKKKFFAALSLSMTMGLSLVSSEAVEASSLIRDVVGKAKTELSDMELANRYLARNPQAAAAMSRDLEDHKEEVRRASGSKKAELIKQWGQQQQIEMMRYANAERSRMELEALKGDRNYKNIQGMAQPEGESEARRLALQCGLDKSVGYSNYFGEPSFYQQKYPQIGPEMADIEAIPLLRSQFLPKIDHDLRKFISNKQLTFVSQSLNTSRRQVHSGYHAQAGQAEYAAKVYQDSTNYHKRRSEQLSDDILADIYEKLAEVKVARPKPETRSVIAERDRTSAFLYVTGREVLNECRYFWANGNTVKAKEPERGEGGWLAGRNQSKRVGVQPNFPLAAPVRPMGKPVALQNLNADEYNYKINKKALQGRLDQYGNALTTNQKDRSAMDVVRENFGENSTILKNNEAYKNARQDGYDSTHMDEARQSVTGSFGSEYDQMQIRRKEKPKKLSFDDIYN